MLIDTHAHLEMTHFDEDREEVIKRFLDKGVGMIIDVGSNLEGSRKAVEYASAYDFIYASVGIHPHDIKNADSSSYKEIESLLNKPKVVAVGETGLDFFKNYSPRDIQIKGFENHIKIARKSKKPIIVHSREAEEDTLAILKNERTEDIGGIMHCFSGGMKFAQECLNLGFYISFSGNITYPKAKALGEVVKMIPADRILIETDSPFLAPQRERGNRNEPAFVSHVAEKVAELKGLSLEDVERNISRNIHRLFGIGAPFDRSKIAYKIRRSLYLNITNRCTNHCVFCERETNPYVQGHNLKLEKEPLAEDLWEAIGNPAEYDEIVFCGYGEPTLRLPVIVELAGKIKEHNGKVRLNTNGHGNLINKRDILPELAGLVDSISISLNAENEEKYSKISQPDFQSNAFKEVKDFILKAKKNIPNVVATVVGMSDEINLEKCEYIATNELGVKFRSRDYNIVG